MASRFPSVDTMGRVPHPRRLNAKRTVREESDSGDEEMEMTGDTLDSGARFAQSRKADQIAIAMHDLGTGTRHITTSTDAGHRVQVIPVHRLLAGRECNQEGTTAAELAQKNKRALAQWGNYGNTAVSKADVEKLPDINGGQSHRAKMQAEVAAERERNGGHLDWEAADDFRGVRGSRGGSRGGWRGGNARRCRVVHGSESIAAGGRPGLVPTHGLAPSHAIGGGRPLDPAVDPDRDYTYKGGSGGKKITIPYSGGSVQRPLGSTPISRAQARGVSRSVRGGRTRTGPGRGDIAQNIRGELDGRVVQVDPAPPRQGIRLDSGLQNDSKHHNSHRTLPRPPQNRSPAHVLPGWFTLLENPVVGLVGTSIQDQKIVDAMPRGRPGFDLLTAETRHQPGSAKKTPSTKPARPKEPSISNPAPPTEAVTPTIEAPFPETPQTELSKFSTRASNLAGSRWGSVEAQVITKSITPSIDRHSIAFMQVAKGLNAEGKTKEPSKRPMPVLLSKAVPLGKTEVAKEQDAASATSLRAPNQEFENIRKVRTSEFVLPPPNNPDARPGEASSWTDGRLSPVSAFSSDFPPLESSPAVGLDDISSENLSFTVGTQAEYGINGLGIAMPGYIVSDAEQTVFPFESITKPATGDARNLMDEEAEPVSQPALQPSLSAEPIPRFRIIEGYCYELVPKNQFQSMQTFAGSQSEPLPAVATFVPTPEIALSSGYSGGTRGLGCNILGNHNLSRRSSGVLQSGSVAAADRGSRKHEPSSTQSRWWGVSDHASFLSQPDASVEVQAKDTFDNERSSSSATSASEFASFIHKSPEEQISSSRNPAGSRNVTITLIFANADTSMTAVDPKSDKAEYLTSTRGGQLAITMRPHFGSTPSAGTVTNARSRSLQNPFTPIEEYVEALPSTNVFAPSEARHDSTSELFTPFGTAAHFFSRHVHMTGLGETEAVAGNEQEPTLPSRPIANREGHIVKENLDQRIVRMVPLNGATGMTPFGGATPQPDVVPQRFASRASSPRNTENLTVSKYATTANKNKSVPLANLPNNGSSAARPMQNPPMSKLAAVDGNNTPLGNERQSTSPIFGDRKNLQSKSSRSESSQMPGGAPQLPPKIQRRPAGPGFGSLLNDLKKFDVSVPGVGLRGGDGTDQPLANCILSVHQSTQSASTAVNASVSTSTTPVVTAVAPTPQTGTTLRVAQSMGLCDNDQETDSD